MPSTSKDDAAEKKMTFEEKQKKKAAETLEKERQEARRYQEELKTPADKTRTQLHPLFHAVAAGNALDVEMLLESLDTHAPEVVLSVDDKGRTALHIAGITIF